MKVVISFFIFALLFGLYVAPIAVNPCFDNQPLTLTASSGTFGCAPNALGFDLSNSAFVINPATGPIALSFSFFDFDYQSDYVEVYYGVSNIPPSVLQKTYTGNKLPATIFTTNAPIPQNNELNVQLFSDDSDYPSGFTAVYTSGNIDPCQSNQYFVFTDYSGTISCNGYANLLKSQWVIQPNRGVITITIDSVNTEPYFDVITIRDGYTKFDQVLGTYFGVINTPITVETNGRVAFIEFSTDGDGIDNGFSLHWETATDPCFENQNIILADPTGSFGCPIGTEDLITSTWLIDAGLGKIYYKFSFFDLENNFDYLYVYDGPNDEFPLLATYTGTTFSPFVTFSSGDSLFFRLITDSDVPSNGFLLEYTALDFDPCVSNSSVKLTNPEGYFGCAFTSAVRLNSSWLIEPNNGQIHVSFSKFSLLPGDYLLVYSGSTVQNQLLFNLTGSELPDAFDSEASSSLFFEFITNDSGLSDGFTAIYTSGETNPCLRSLDVTLTSEVGSFGCSSIAPSVTSSWTIFPPVPQNILLNFTSVSLSTGDALYIYDGDSQYDRFLGDVTTNVIETFQASGRSLFVQLISNEQSDSSSFAANFGSLVVDHSNPTPINNPIVTFSRSPSVSRVVASVSPILGGLGTGSRIPLAPSHYTIHPTPPAEPSQLFFSPSPSTSHSPSISKTSTPLPGPSVQPYRIGTPIEVFANLHCIVNITQCCADFTQNWANLSFKNSANLIDLLDCSSLTRDDNLPNFTVKLNQYGSNFNNAMSIVKDYWSLLGCVGNPVEQPLCIPDNIVTNTEWNKINLISMNDPFPVVTNSYTSSTQISTESTITEISLIIVPNTSSTLATGLFMLLIIVVFF